MSLKRTCCTIFTLHILGLSSACSEKEVGCPILTDDLAVALAIEVFEARSEKNKNLHYWDGIKPNNRNVIDIKSSASTLKKSGRDFFVYFSEPNSEKIIISKVYSDCVVEWSQKSKK